MVQNSLLPHEKFLFHTLPTPLPKIVVPRERGKIKKIYHCIRGGEGVKESNSNNYEGK